MEPGCEGYFEDLNVGDEFVSPARTVTEADVVGFASLSGDYNQQHTDAEYARTTLLGARVAHGLLGVSIASGLMSRIKEIRDDKFVAFLSMKWTFRKPVFIGDTVHMILTVARKREAGRFNAGMVRFKMVVLNQRDDRVQTGEFTLLVKRRPAPEQDIE